MPPPTRAASPQGRPVPGRLRPADRRARRYRAQLGAGQTCAAGTRSRPAAHHRPRPEDRPRRARSLGHGRRRRIPHFVMPGPRDPGIDLERRPMQRLGAVAGTAVATVDREAARDRRARGTGNLLRSPRIFYRTTAFTESRACARAAAAFGIVRASTGLLIFPRSAMSNRSTADRRRGLRTLEVNPVPSARTQRSDGGTGVRSPPRAGAGMPAATTKRTQEPGKPPSSTRGARHSVSRWSCPTRDETDTLPTPSSSTSDHARRPSPETKRRKSRLSRLGCAPGSVARQARPAKVKSSRDWV